MKNALFHLAGVLLMIGLISCDDSSDGDFHLDGNGCLLGSFTVENQDDCQRVSELKCVSGALVFDLNLVGDVLVQDASVEYPFACYLPKMEAVGELILRNGYYDIQMPNWTSAETIAITRANVAILSTEKIETLDTLYMYEFAGDLRFPALKSVRFIDVIGYDPEMVEDDSDSSIFAYLELPELESVEESAEFTYLDQLTLGKLSDVGDTLRLSSLSVFGDVSGLEAVRRLSLSNAHISDVMELAFPRLTTLESLQLEYLPVDSVSFDSLGVVADYIYITDNEYLTTLSLPAITTVSGDIYIDSNGQLPGCQVCDLVGALSQESSYSCSDLLDDSCWDSSAEQLTCP